jgi:hypothetical protein
MPTDHGFSGIWGTATDDVWAVGQGGFLVHFDGVSWDTTAFPVAANAFYSIWGASPAELWAVGDGIIRYDGAAWTSDEGHSCQEVWGYANDNVFATCWGNAFLRFDGATWQQLGGQPTGIARANGIWGTAASGIWFAVEPNQDADVPLAVRGMR